MILETKYTGKKILIDDEDMAILYSLNRSFSVSSHGYAQAVDYIGRVDGKYRYKKHYLHRLILKAPPHLQVDHINGDRLDNRKENLRLCNNASNNRNKAQYKGAYKGVYFAKRNKKWTAQITKNRKVYSLGLFEDITDAAKAYNKAAKQLHGKYAFLNNV